MTSKTKRRVFFTMVDHPGHGWLRVGSAFGSRAAAKEWLPLVKGRYRCCRVRISQCTLMLDEQGKPDARSAQVLTKKFNLEVAP